MDKSKENLRNIYSKFGVNLTDSELNRVWIEAQNKKITPLGDRFNMAVSPRMAINLIRIALTQAGNDITDRRFKKISEEIMPAIHFVLFLKKKGLGEYYILSRDVPDIALIKKQPYPKNLRKILAIPLEVTFIKESDFKNINYNNSNEEVLVNTIASRKFNKKYYPETTLLIVIDVISNIKTNVVYELLIKNNSHNFHNIWIYGQTGENSYAIAKVYPELNYDKFDIEKDFIPIMY